MKKSYKYISAAAVTVLTAACAVSAAASSQEDAAARKWGKILSDSFYEQQDTGRSAV